MYFPMGLRDRLTGKRKPDSDVPAMAPQDMRHTLLSLNRESAPWQVRDGTPEGVDLVAEWKIVDASWYEIFAKANLERTFKILMRLDGENREVRAVDQEWSVSWKVGAPSLSLDASRFRGRQWEMSFGSGYAFTEQGQYGEVYKYRFNTGELKTPLKEAVTGAGWTYRPISFGKL
jgi:hypothetical protein